VRRVLQLRPLSDIFVYICEHIYVYIYENNIASYILKIYTFMFPILLDNRRGARVRRLLQLRPLPDIYLYIYENNRASYILKIYMFVFPILSDHRRGIGV